jgi:hypothetical protein
MLMRLTLNPRTALLVAACGLLAANGQAAPATTASQPALRGQTWDSIKRLPDWSGVWAPSRPMRPRGAGPGIGFVFGGDVPLKPKYAAMRDERMAAVRGERGRDKIPLSNSGLCLPNGTPANMGPVAHEYLFSPGRVTILLENSEIRRIWTDGRPHVPDDEVNPSFSGDSIGHWEGDTLVVDTVNFNDKTWIDRVGHPHTADLHLVEHFKRVQKDHLVDDITIEDAKAYSKPWTAHLDFVLRSTWTLGEQFCEDEHSFENFDKKGTAGAK